MKFEIILLDNNSGQRNIFDLDPVFWIRVFRPEPEPDMDPDPSLLRSE